MDAERELVVSEGYEAESEEGECSSDDEVNSSGLVEFPDGGLEAERTCEGVAMEEVESGDRIKAEKLMQLG